mmetsp:Transcript_3248/g.7680  ORF Transcript_3248/g.7680 Transcript_3248/m.7680 type:complete len:218 (-) Transcript_3248:38-691(-)
MFRQHVSASSSNWPWSNSWMAAMRTLSVANCAWSCENTGWLFFPAALDSFLGISAFLWIQDMCFLRFFATLLRLLKPCTVLPLCSFGWPSGFPSDPCDTCRPVSGCAGVSHAVTAAAPAPFAFLLPACGISSSSSVSSSVFRTEPSTSAGSEGEMEGPMVGETPNPSRRVSSESSKRTTCLCVSRRLILKDFKPRRTSSSCFLLASAMASLTPFGAL